MSIITPVNSINGSAKNGFLKGLSGVDSIIGGSGSERIMGMAGNDYMFDGAGSDRFYGGTGSDTFAFGLDGRLDRIMDFQIGLDVIDLQAWGVTGVEDLTITALRNGQISITFGTETLLVKALGKTKLTATSLTEDSFVFQKTRVDITFDELTFSGSFDRETKINDDDAALGGFTWSDSFYFGDAELFEEKYTLANRDSSGSNVGFNGYEGDVWFKATDAFDFDSAKFGALHMDSLKILVTGLNDGVETGRQVLTVSANGTSLIELDDAIFDEVDEVRLSTTDATLGNGGSLTTSGTHFYIDDLVLFV